MQCLASCSPFINLTQNQVDGEVRYGITQPEYKEYLSMMHQCIPRVWCNLTLCRLMPGTVKLVGHYR